MRFMMLMIPKGYETAEPGIKLDPKRVEEMMKYNEALQKAGVLLALDGLHPPSSGARVSFAGGTPTVTDGPFIEAKEVLGGYWMIQVNSREEAIEWAKRCPGSDNETIEIRQVQEMSDYDEDVKKAAAKFPDIQASVGQPTSAQATAPTDAAATVPTFTPYLFFNGNCREAFEFYAGLFGGTIEAMLTHRETPASEQTPEEWQDKIIHACLRVGDRRLMASDAPPQYASTPAAFRVHFGVPDREKAERIFNTLAEGGKVAMPFAQTFWARGFGMVTDRFGTPWMISTT
jgi:PhnB protein